MRPFTTITVLVLALVALMHALRLWFGWGVSVDGLVFPTWASAVGLVIAAVLAAGVWREARARAQLPVSRGPVALDKREVRSFTVIQGKRYRASIALGFFEQIASNETIAGMLRDVGFSEVSVAGSGSVRNAEALWPGADRTGELPPQIQSVSEIAV